MLIVGSEAQIIITDSPLERIGSRLYKKELLTSDFKDPKELAYDSSSRNLFFMYMDDEIQNSGRAFVNTITKQSKKIKGIEKNKATVVDSDTSDVYFGTENGLYKYDPLENIAVNIGLYNVNIMKLVIRNNEMYLLDANNHMIYKVLNKGTSTVKVGNMKTVMEFEVDNARNIHYVAMCGVFCMDRKDYGIVKNKDLTDVYHFIVDGNRTLGVTEDGIYEINCNNGTARKQADLVFIPRSIIFGDYGDVYYSISNSIFKLKPISSFIIYNVRRKKN